ncbi:MAG TPA: 3,4-dihydroxy-2-butanone-4-phosphate synthase, partial [Gemmatimonadaceae bacterium]|nr:3,4-dihydroxy-2-butanone-4-phosphate synthase [Gemmatimonadaceae bacterium]
MSFGTVEQAIADIAAGKVVVVADDEDRENEGDLVCAAQLATPATVNFMVAQKGMLCLALTAERVEQLALAPLSKVNTEAQRTAFTESIDAAPRFGVTTGISAADRATTIRVAVDP